MQGPTFRAALPPASPQVNAQCQTAPPVAAEAFDVEVIATEHAPNARVPWHGKLAIAFGSVFTWLAASPDAKAANAPQTAEQPIPTVEFDMTPGILGYSWKDCAYAGVFVTSTALLYLTRHSARSSRGEKSWKASALRWCRRILWGAAAFSGLNLFGVQTKLAAAGSLALTAVVGINSKDLINNVSAYGGLVFRDRLKVGDHIKVDGVSGKVIRIEPTAVIVEGVDDKGVIRQYYIPPNRFLSNTWEKTECNDDALKNIKVGKYIHVTGFPEGRVASVNDYSVIVHWVNERGVPDKFKIDKHLITKDTRLYLGYKKPPLPRDIEKDMEIELAGVRGRVHDWDAHRVVLVSKGGEEHHIPRTALSDSFTIFPQEASQIEET